MSIEQLRWKLKDLEQRVGSAEAMLQQLRRVSEDIKVALAVALHEQIAAENSSRFSVTTLDLLGEDENV